MKKFLFFFLIAFFVFVGGCSISKSNVDLPFEQANSIVSNNIVFLLNGINLFSENNKFVSDCVFSGEDDNLKLDLNLNVVGFFDQKENINFDLFSDTYFFDKKANKEVVLSGLVQNFLIQNKGFVNLSDFSVSMGKGNYESALWYMILQKIGSKRIKYDSNILQKFKNNKSNIKFTTDVFSYSDIFENKEKVVYEGKIAYKVGIRDDILKFLNENLNVEILDFEGLIVVNSERDVVLNIDKIGIKYKKGDSEVILNINGFFGEESGGFSIGVGGNSVEIEYELHRRYTKLEISKYKDLEKIYKISVDVFNTQKKDLIKYNLDGVLEISPEIIYGSDLEKDMEINISCHYENFYGETYEVKEPDNYLLLDQILGDEFSIKSFF